MKLKDIEYKNSSLVSQIDRKNMKEKSKLLLKCFVNSFTKNPPAWNFTFWTKKKVKEKDSDLKISSPVVQIDRKNRKKKIKLLLKWFANLFRKKSSNMCWECAKTA